MCRLYGSTQETQEHAVNCCEIVDNGQYMDLRDIYGDVPLDDSKVRDTVSRYVCFEEKALGMGREKVFA